MIRQLLEEIERSINANLFHVGLLAALTVPDIAGALDSEDGNADKTKYARWFDKYTAPSYYSYGEQLITGIDCYGYRCALLHQGRAMRRSSRYSKTVFLFAKQRNIAYCGAFKLDKGKTLAIDIPLFCHNMLRGAHTWLNEVEDTPRFRVNSTEFMKLFQLSFGS